MNCPQVRDGLPLYVGGDLTDDERNAVDEHLQGCADCRVRLERTRAVIAPLRGLGPVDAPVPDADVLWSRISADMGWSAPAETREKPAAVPLPMRRWGRTLLRAAAVFALGLGLGLAATLAGDRDGGVAPRDPSRPMLSEAMRRPDLASRTATPVAEGSYAAGRLPMTTFGDFGIDGVQTVDSASGSARRFFVWNALPPDAAPSRRTPASLRFHLEQIQSVDGEELVAGY